MEGVKSLFASKTFWGALTAIAGILPTLLPLFGFSVSAEDSVGLVQQLGALIAAAGALFAIFGRIVASKKIG